MSVCVRSNCYSAKIISANLRMDELALLSLADFVYQLLTHKYGVEQSLLHI